MNDKPDGGPAFPNDRIHVLDEIVCSTGMTLRDYFAAKALVIKFGPEGSSMAMSQTARMCYEMADAMLEARK